MEWVEKLMNKLIIKPIRSKTVSTKCLTVKNNHKKLINIQITRKVILQLYTVYNFTVCCNFIQSFLPI